eukprot:9743541-Ditylum_brightwellii.AAC.1
MNWSAAVLYGTVYMSMYSLFFAPKVEEGRVEGVQGHESEGGVNLSWRSRRIWTPLSLVVMDRRSYICLPRTLGNLTASDISTSACAAARVLVTVEVDVTYRSQWKGQA